MRLTPPTRTILTLLAAALGALAAPPWNAWPLTFIAFVPLLLTLRGRTIGASIAYGALFGLASALFRFGWVISVFDVFVDHQRALTAILASLFFAIDTIRFAALGLAVGLGTRARVPLVASFPIALLGAEALFRPIHPWATGYALAGAPLLAQAADLGGVPLLSLAIAIANALVADATTWRRSLVARIALVPALLGGYGAIASALAIARERSAEPIRVALVQANMESGAKALRVLETYEDATVAYVGTHPVDLVVWPEGAVEYALDPQHLDDSFVGYVRLETRMRGKGPALLAGGLIQRRELQAAENSAILAEADGHVRGSYGKVNPMPFGEYLPFADRFPGLRAYFPNAGDVPAAAAPTALSFRGHTIQARICYEEVLADETRDAARATSPELFVGLTDDVWFGDSPASEFHLAVARMRAIEHRRYVVRAVNDGPSAIIDSLGRLQTVAPVRAAATIDGTARWLGAPTLYTRLGAAPAWAAALVGLGITLARTRRRAAPNEVIARA
jgi:apolipoprotein N-acyltransferase